jgi:hypothetical protein
MKKLFFLVMGVYAAVNVIFPNNCQAWTFEMAVVCEGVDSTYRPINITDKRWAVGSEPWFFANIKEIGVDHRFMFSVIRNGEPLYSAREDGWRQVTGGPWPDSAMYGRVENAQAGYYQVDFFLDTGDGFFLLASVNFSVGTEYKSYFIPDTGGMEGGTLLIKNFAKSTAYGTYKVYGLINNQARILASGEAEPGVTRINLEGVSDDSAIGIYTSGFKMHAVYNNMVLKGVPQANGEEMPVGSSTGMFLPHVTSDYYIVIQNWTNQTMYLDVKGLNNIGDTEETTEITIPPYSAWKQKATWIFSNFRPAAIEITSLELPFYGEVIQEADCDNAPVKIIPAIHMLLLSD